MDLVKLWTVCSSNNVVLSLEQLNSLERYHNELKYWNSKVNLISRKDEDNIFERHILHSLAIVKYVDFPHKSKVLDIGTGGGLPGIPVKIANPEIDLLMVDSINKKVKITKMFAQHTGLRKIDAVWARAESLSENQEYRRNFNFVLSRAVAKTEIIIGWIGRIIKPGAKIVLLKGGDLSEEISASKNLYPNLDIKEIQIDFIGVPYFKEEGKKILICTFEKD
ncbi:MAG: 16S rRNA (guanine(527)-N(7))-methyltransferase RsmG [Candidatus Kapabacteria bacterium]|nr:16S rRNA (guanine(527)-N(7))-methyltransferase RsmG [Ignavibacteriota bacterium]MCW5885448.1 16S rRNA (guanine(527)-N(7))-methyltransferase RsmG [Candidatus Kapabacteria bacterium]